MIRSALLLFAAAAVAHGATYYLDAGTGDDSAAGTSPRSAWKSLDRVNRLVLAPGDEVLLKAGSVFTGALRPRGSGSEAAPVRIGRYGEGALPRIDARGEAPETLLLHNVEFYEVADLELTNTGRDRAPGRAGVRVRAEDFGTMRRIHLRRLFIRDVNGSLVKGDGDELAGFGIQWVGEGPKPSRFDDLLIEDCRLLRTDRNGICGASNFVDRRHWFASTRVVIRGNQLEDIGGDGIVPLGCEGALVERNVIRGGRTRAQDYCAGIWPWSCDGTVIQFNEVSGMVGTKDGQGFDSDYNCRNTLIQYNYSHDNEGGFILICNDGRNRPPGGAGNTGTIVRYNISQNDRTRLVQLGGPCENVRIYNNVFFVGKGLDVRGVLQGNWNGVNKAGDIVFENNIFFVEGRLTDEIEAGPPPVFRNNILFGNYETKAAQEKTLRVDPRFVAPGRGGEGFASLAGYKLQPGSPAIGAGVAQKNNGGRDFWGDPVSALRAPAIGADEP